MSNLTLSIGGRSFTVACADGEEAHVSRLGQIINDKVSQGNLAGLGESRMLLFAALLLADENHELSAKAAPPTDAPASDIDSQRLAQLAERLENLASLLESGQPSA